MAIEQSERSFAQLFTDALNEVTGLFQTEIRLARAEISDKINQTVSGLVVIAIGAVLLMASLVILLEAVVLGLVALGIPEGWAALIVAVVIAVIGGILVAKGISALKPSNLTPDRTINQLQRDATVAREQVR